MRVKFWPKRNEIHVNKCSHRFGAKMTYCNGTDSRFLTSIYAYELYAFKHNIRVGNFVTNLLGQSEDGIPDTEKTGVIRHDIYFGTDEWLNPTTGQIEVIPDYLSTTWSASGAAAFSGAIEGQSKPARYPDHGQELFDISGGVYGMDYATGTLGSNNLSELEGVVNSQSVWLKNITGRWPSCISYRNGANSVWRAIMRYFLGGRNSIPSPSDITKTADTFYGAGLGNSNTGLLAATRSFFINFPNSFRWWDCWNGGSNTEQQATEYVTDLVTATISNEGKQSEFQHVHSTYANGTLNSIDRLFASVRAAASNNFIWTCSNGESIEYLFIREMVNRVTALDRGDHIIVLADIDDKFKDEWQVLYNQINIPLSVEIDLSNTSLAGKDIIASSGKCRNLGNDKYIIEIKFNKQEGFISTILKEGTGGYYIETPPVISANIVGNKLTVNTDIPSKIAVFSVNEGGNDWESRIYQRSNAFDTTHVFAIESGRDYRIGAISEFYQCSLLEL